jgi:hypothetical protein
VDKFLSAKRRDIQHTVTAGHSNRPSTKCRKALQNPFGAYAQVHANAQNNSAMISRTVGAISLGPTGNIQGTYKFMSLLTGRLIKARSFAPLPIPEEVIKQVEEMTPISHLSDQDEANTDSDPRTAYPEHQLPHDDDDISLGSSDYSKISQGEMNDITIEGRDVNGEDMGTIIPETVLSHDNVPNEGSQAQGVEDDFEVDNENLSQASDIEGVEKIDVVMTISIVTTLKNRRTCPNL